MSRMNRGMRLAPAVAAAAALRGNAGADAASKYARVLLQQKYSILKASNADGSAPAGGTKWDFFQQNNDPQTTNLKQPGRLVQGSGAFDALALCFHVDIDSGDNQIDDDLTGADLAEVLRKYLMRGSIEFKMGQRTLMDPYGLSNFPSGGGASGFGAVATTATTTSQAGWVVNNGEPRADNRLWFPTPITFTQDDPVFLSVDFGSKIAAPSGVIVRIMASLWGIETTDAIK